jgi:multiple sugar transport system permease protein
MAASDRVTKRGVRGVRRVAKRLERRFPIQWLLVAPAGILLAGAVAMPIVGVTWLSLTDASLAGSIPEFVGLENYVDDVLLNDRFYNAIFVTAVFVAAAVLVQFLLGFGLALLLWGSERRRRIFMPVLLAPMFITWIAVGLIFRFLLSPKIGVVPYLLSFVNISVPWFTDPTWAMISLVIADVWEWTPFMMVLTLAGLESLPRAPHEAARTDGASDLEVFVDVTLPLMKPVIGTALLIRSIEASKVFPKVIGMTNGGPGISTESVGFLIYKTGFTNFNLGPASAQALTVTLMVIGFVYVTYRMGGIDDV